MSRESFLKNKQILIGLALVPIPILTYWIYWTLNSSYWFNFDPAAVYFLDSLSVFAGKSYTYVDHPGTPMQLIGSFLLGLTYPFFDGKNAFIQFFIARPGAFFLMANAFLLATNLFCVIVFYRTVVSSLTNNRILAGAAISLLFFALHPFSFPSLTFWSHNSINFPIGTLLLVWLYRELNNNHEIAPSKIILLGFASGILSMAQMYFIAWVIGLAFTVFIFSLRMTRNVKSAFTSSVYAMIGAGMGILSMLIPIYKELPRFFEWFTGIVTHTGLYGTGESGLLSLNLISLSMSFWWNNIRFMILILIASILILAILTYQMKNTGAKLPAGDSAMIIGLIFHIGLVMLFMIKAALKLRYSLSLAGILPVLVFMVLKVIDATGWKIKIQTNIFYTLLLAVVVFSLVSQKKIVDNRSYVEQDAQIAKEHAVNRLANQLKVKDEDIVTVYAYAVPLKCSGLLHSSNWTGHFRNEISQICPKQHAYWDSDIVLNMIEPQKELSTIDWDLVIWPGNGTDLPDYLHSIGAITIPKSWHVRRSQWFFIHSAILDE